jgi:hypothetical protein
MVNRWARDLIETALEHPLLALLCRTLHEHANFNNHHADEPYTVQYLGFRRTDHIENLLDRPISQPSA